MDAKETYHRELLAHCPDILTLRCDEFAGQPYAAEFIAALAPRVPRAVLAYASRLNDVDPVATEKALKVAAAVDPEAAIDNLHFILMQAYAADIVTPLAQKFPEKTIGLVLEHAFDYSEQPGATDFLTDFVAQHRKDVANWLEHSKKFVKGIDLPYPVEFHDVLRAGRLNRSIPFVEAATGAPRAQVQSGSATREETNLAPVTERVASF